MPCGDDYPIAIRHHLAAERYGFGRCVRLIPVCALPRGFEQMAVYPHLDGGNALYLLVPLHAAHPAYRAGLALYHIERDDDWRQVAYAYDFRGGNMPLGTIALLNLYGTSRRSAQWLYLPCDFGYRRSGCGGDICHQEESCFC